MKRRWNIRLAAVALVALPAAAFAAGTASDPMTPQAVRRMLDTAQAFIDNGQYRRAVSVLDEIVREQPRNADAFNLLGYSWRKMKGFERSERYYKIALSIDPAHRGALEYAGELYLQTGRRAEAEAMLELLEAACPAGCEELDDLRAVFADTSGANW